jgi:signal peptidase I
MGECERSRPPDPAFPCAGSVGSARPRRRPSGAALGTTLTAAVLATALLFRAVRRRLLLVEVVGDSMAPTYRHGDRLLVVRRRRFRTGQVVIAARGMADLAPGGCPWLVKRLAAMPGEATPEAAVAASGGRRTVPAHAVVLLGDSPASIDSRSVGFVPLADLGGVVLGRTRTAAGRTATL